MRDIRGEVGKKTPKKEIDNPSFLWRHMADFGDTLSRYINFFFVKEGEVFYGHSLKINDNSRKVKSPQD